MVKCWTDWNGYVNNLEPYEPYELEEIYSVESAMEVFALKFDFGERKQGYISGKITIRPGGHTLFTTPTYDDFQLINTGKFTQLSGGTEVPINAITPVKIKLDLFDKSYGILDFGLNYGFSGVEKEEEEEEDDDEEEKEEEEKEEEEEEEEEDEEERRRKEEEYAAGEELLHTPNKYDLYFPSPRVEMTADEVARANQICGIWDDSIGFDCDYTEKLLHKKVTCQCFSLEVLYAVYKDAMAATVYVTFADWNPSYLSRRDMSNGMHVYGQVTVRNTLLTHPDAITTLFGKEIDELFHINLGDPIPMLKTFVVFPRKSSLLLDIDLRHVLRNSGDHNHKLPTSELFAKTTLEITYQHSSYNRFVVEDSGPAKLFVDVMWQHLNDLGILF